LLDTEKIKSKINEVIELVKDLDDPYRIEAFKIVLDKVLKVGKDDDLQADIPEDVPEDSSINPMNTLAKEADISVSELKNVFEFEDNEFLLVRKIDEDTDSKKQVMACQLIITANMRGKKTDWVLGSSLREIVNKNGLGNPKNLAANLSKAGIFRTKDSGKASKYSLITEGWQAGLESIKQLSKGK